MVYMSKFNVILLTFSYILLLYNYNRGGYMRAILEHILNNIPKLNHSERNQLSFALSSKELSLIAIGQINQ